MYLLLTLGTLRTFNSLFPRRYPLFSQLGFLRYKLASRIVLLQYAAVMCIFQHMVVFSFITVLIHIEFVFLAGFRLSNYEVKLLYNF